jgi:hypothetical protein
MDIDYCLACDRPSEHGAYCSHACRSADIERCKPAPATTDKPTSGSPPEMSDFDTYSHDLKSYNPSSSSSQPSSKRSSMSGLSMTSISSKNRYDYLWKQETPLSAQARATLFQYDGYFNLSTKTRPALYKRFTLG